MSNYNQPTKKDIPEEEYLKQKIEVDAVAFAHFQLLNLYQVKTFIPPIITDEVKTIIKSFEKTKSYVRV